MLSARGLEREPGIFNRPSVWSMLQLAQWKRGRWRRLDRHERNHDSHYTEDYGWLLAWP